MEFFTIAMIGFLGAMSPGPDFFIVSKNALQYSRASGIATTLGISLGVCLHCSYCIFGLSLLLMHAQGLFEVLRYVGAVYLFYLGIKALFGTHVIQDNTNNRSGNYTLAHAFKEGFLINLLNPKCILFLVSIFTLLIKPETAHSIQIIYGLELILAGLIWFCVLSVLLTHQRFQRAIQKVQPTIIKLMGVFLMFFAISLLFANLSL